MLDAIAAAKSFFHRTADLGLAAGLVAAGIYFFSGRFTTVRFDRERVEIQVERRHIEVTGLYHYTNDSWLPAVLTLRVPFPVDSDHPRPHTFSLAAADADGGVLADIVPVVSGADVRFRLIFWPGEGKWIRLDYAQRTGTPSGRYILTTTRAWRRPLGRGEYLLRLARNFQLVSSNYPVSATSAGDRWKAYIFSRTDFYPDRDWEFAWDEPRSPEGSSVKGDIHETRDPRKLPAAVVPIDRRAAGVRE